MKKKWKGLLFAGLLLMSGLSGIYALPKVYVSYQVHTGKVDIHLEEYRLEDGKEVPWQAAENVLPGSLVSKIPRIYNDGADCYIRTKVTFASKHPSGKPLTTENLEGISQKWMRDGDYFYYKEMVKAGDIVDFFRGIRIPGEWENDPDAENQWEATVRAEAVQAACFHPDFSGQDPWGLETKNFTVQQAISDEVQEQQPDETQVELVIAANLPGFTVEQEGCMKTLDTFMPGKTQEGSVKIKNETAKKREVFLGAGTPQKSPLFEKLELTVQVREKGKIRVLYQGKVTEGMLTEKQSLGVIPAGEETQVEFLFALPADADNVYAAKAGKVTFWFTTDVPEESQIVVAPRTGDRYRTRMYAAAGLGAGAGLLLLSLCRILQNRKRRRRYRC